MLGNQNLKKFIKGNNQKYLFNISCLINIYSSISVKLKSFVYINSLTYSKLIIAINLLIISFSNLSNILNIILIIKSKSKTP